MITVAQIVCHLIGDFIIQSDWMAQRKVHSTRVALLHGVSYAIPFYLWLHPSFWAMVIIILTHCIIDRWRLARFVVYAKNQLAPKGFRCPWADCSQTGYDKDRPVWLTTWLLIIVDNLLHLLVNGFVLAYL